MLSTRLALLNLAAQHKLSAASVQGLWRLAGLDAQPRRLMHWTRLGLSLLGAGLGGLGLIFLIAANWGSLGRAGQFALLQGLLLVLCVGAAHLPGARTALGLAALLTIGGLFAAIGQTYQTGADPWQLFAVWALLGLPIALAIRSDVLWTAWVVVAMVGISLWGRAHAASLSGPWAGEVGVYAAASVVAVVLALLLSRPLRRYSGAGLWAFGAAFASASILLTAAGLMGLSTDGSLAIYFITVAIVGGCAFGFASDGRFDIFAISISALALNFLVFGGVAKVLFGDGATLLISLLVLGLIAAAMLSATVAIVLRLHRRNAQLGGAA